MATRDIFQERQLVVKGLIILMGIVLIGRALSLQVLDREFQKKASATGIDKVIVHPGRGLIYDRNNKLMLNNEALYDIMVTYNELNPQMDTMKLCRLLQISKDEFLSNITKDFKSIRYSKAKPYLFLAKVSPEVCTRFQEYLFEFPGFSIDLKNVRSYPYKCAAQVLGYISEVNQKNIDESHGTYAKGDIIGSTGLEFEYEQFIRGTKGINYLLKDNFGKPLGPYRGGIADSMAVAGKDIEASIDIDLQQYGEELMAGKSGSIVAIEPETGDILAMISAPTYDPNLLAINKNRGQFFKELQADNRKPFFDRTVMAKYPPGSIFKPLVALIGLQEGVLSAGQGMDCGGGFHYNNLTVKCVHNHGYLRDVAHGIGQSCNNYFCTVFKDIIDKYGFSSARQGYQTFINHLYDFGLGKPLDLDYPNEKGGNVPSVSYYDRLYPKERGGWYSTTIISMGIGQGEIQMTTIQMANLAATIANRGYFYTPHLIKRFKDGTPIPIKFTTRHQTRIQAKHFEPVIDGMELVVLTGTAQNARIPGIDIVGKTGTVQNPQNKDKDHSVFYGFAPKYNPKIAVAAYVEYGGWGSTVAAPIASLLIEKYLKGSVSRNEMETQIKQKVLSNYDN